MKLLIVKYDTRQFTKAMKNTMAYSLGFMQGVESNRLKFNIALGEYTKIALSKYIDSQARANPEALHHVYEPGMVGSESGRLFDFQVSATTMNISFTGNFFPSSGIPLNGGYPFQNKAEIMEDQISITISPKRGKVLVFEYEGETVFTPNTIYIDHPGGDAVAGSFGKTVDKFFLNFFTNAMLGPMIADMQSAKEFTSGFANAAKGGRSAGLIAGRKYLDRMALIA